MIVTEWRDLPSSAVLPLLNAERERYLSRLGWDLGGSVEIIEDARSSGFLPGYVASDDDGKALGWSYFVLHDGTLQIGALSTSRGSIARVLLEAILDSPEAALARRLSCFVYPGCSGVASAFSRQRFVLSESHYLVRDLESLRESPPAIPAASVRTWRDDDLPGLVRILDAGYRDVPGADCFAPDGRRDQWAHYAAQLVRTPAVGAFDPSLSLVLTGSGAESHRLLGVVIATRLGPGTMHLAQVVIDPMLRRQGAGAALVQLALIHAANAGFSRATLMVDARNVPARTLYARLGFVEGEKFLFGQRAARTRLALRLSSDPSELRSGQAGSAALVYQ